jgi:hypothetical protein
MSNTRVECLVNAPRAQVYRALLDARAVTKWMGPTASGTHLLALHDALPAGIAPADHEQGFRMSLAKLKALVEAASQAR